MDLTHVHAFTAAMRRKDKDAMLTAIKMVQDTRATSYGGLTR